MRLFDWAMFLICGVIFIWIASQYPFQTLTVGFLVLVIVRATWGMWND